MEFTRLEIKIMSHRLEVECAMAEVLHDEEGHIKPYSFYKDIVWIRATRLIQRIQDECDLDIYEYKMIADICSDETFCDLTANACHDGDVSKAYYTAVVRSQSQLRRKLESVMKLQAELLGVDFKDDHQ